MDQQPRKPIAPRQSFVARSIRSENVYLVKGKDSTGRQAWYYVHVHSLKKRQFEALTGMAQMNLNDYGNILLSGYGDEPPQDIVKLARDDYGFEAG
jgi:hypothetical protein